MLCPHCGAAIPGRNLACPSCRTLPDNPLAGALAPPGLRLAGYLVDVAVMAVKSWAARRSLTPASALFVLAVTVVELTLLARGQSCGKWLLGMRTYLAGGKKPAGFWRMLLRETVGKLISALPFLLGFLAILWSPDRRAWHDVIAGTLVIHERTQKITGEDAANERPDCTEDAAGL